jgi:N-acetylneuraminate synthase
MQYDIPFIKIPSAMLTNDELISASVKTNKKIILSTGMSTESEIDHAVSLLGDNFALLHCNSTYPAPVNELNLSAIKTLQEKYNCEVGYSGHEMLLGTTVSSVLLGATIIERHITLDRNMEGSDHSGSVTPHGLFKLVSGVRELEQAYGDGKLIVTESEMSVRKKLRG